MDAETKRLVRQRAGNRCEYCGLDQNDEPYHRFHVEHIVPKQHHGDDVLENLALACYFCNLHKGTNLTAIDRESGEIVRLFDPRHDHWSSHFAVIGLEIIGLDPKGRATVELLQMNAVERMELRSILRDNS